MSLQWRLNNTIRPVVFGNKNETFSFVVINYFELESAGYFKIRGNGTFPV